MFLAPNCEWTTRALIDTGSPITIFDRGAADALLVKIGAAGAEKASIALLGKQRIVQFEYIELCLPHDPLYSWTARIGFIPLTLDPSPSGQAATIRVPHTTGIALPDAAITAPRRTMIRPRQFNLCN